MFKLVVSNLIQRPTRTIVSVLAVSLGVLLVLVSVGLSYGALKDSAERTRRMGDILFQPPKASIFTVLNQASLPIEAGPLLEEVSGVRAATPVLSKFLGAERFGQVYGIDRDSFLRVNTSLRILRGHWFEEPSDLIIDTRYSESNQLDLGGAIELFGQTFTVSGIYEAGTGARVMMPLSTLQKLNESPNKATMFFLRVDDRESVDSVHRRLSEHAKFGGYQFTKTSELLDLLMSDTPAFKQFLGAIVFIAASVSFMIILLAMYSTITERTREIGILKSLGASKLFIIRMIVKESLLICSLGVGLGFILTVLAIKLVVLIYPNLTVDITNAWRLAAVAMGIGGGVLGALYPAMKAAQLDPVRALGYE